ncbi:hypothetical protein HERIO_47 [Hepatospora eriocheir]|uniref:RRM domain-containing protein n=1 Tax=Hepatospora eriocheir TaxID=1081669 RepID=A0A1X0QEP4_9MICR|nr:hypothetical protein HERIO_47 [Hepatospora eriocheir]
MSTIQPTESDNTKNIFTKRLAVKNVYFELVPVSRLFKIFYLFVENSITSVKQYVKDGNSFCIAEFTSNDAAKTVYEMMNNFDIEDTKQEINFYVVPESMNDFGDLLTTCKSPKDYVHDPKKYSKIQEKIDKQQTKTQL